MGESAAVILLCGELTAVVRNEKSRDLFTTVRGHYRTLDIWHVDM